MNPAMTGPKTNHAGVQDSTLPMKHGASTATRKTLTLSQLLNGAQSVDIAHNGHVYRLQVTRAGKLILTK